MMIKTNKINTIMTTDYHCHVLPGIDDGAKTLEISQGMLAEMKRQGMQRIVLTPHFYPHREQSIENYLQRRADAFGKIADQDFQFYLGAEIAIERGFSEIPGIEKLAISGTDLILLELPFSGFGRWILDEIHNLVCETKLHPILAHIHRYSGVYSKSELEEILNLNVIFQVNAEAFDTFSGRAFVKKLYKRDVPVVFGSDAHNLQDRAPDYHGIFRHVKPEQLLHSDEILIAYTRTEMA